MSGTGREREGVRGLLRREGGRFMESPGGRRWLVRAVSRRPRTGEPRSGKDRLRQAAGRRRRYATPISLRPPRIKQMMDTRRQDNEAGCDDTGALNRLRGVPCPSKWPRWALEDQSRLPPLTWEPVSGFESLTCRLQEGRPRATYALAAPIAHVIALTAPAALGLSGTTFHEPFHADGRQRPMAATEGSDRNPPQRCRNLTRWSNRTGRPPVPCAAELSRTGSRRRLRRHVRRSPRRAQP